jgi:phage terminase small subunit
MVVVKGKMVAKMTKKKDNINPKGDASERAMTPQQALFCEEYIKDLNITQAAIRAGYSATFADRRAHELLGKVGIQARITELREAASRRNEITLDQILSEYKKIAFLDVRKLYTEDGSVIPIANLDDDTAAAIAGVDVQRMSTGNNEQISVTTTKIRLSDKRLALDSLCRVLGFNAPEKKEHSGSISVEQITGMEVK